MEIWIILGFFACFVGGIGAYLGFTWAVKREAFRLYQKGKSIQATEKRLTTTNESVALLGELKGILGEQGDFKEKLPKALALFAQYPDGSEALFSKVKRFL